MSDAVIAAIAALTLGRRGSISAAPTRSAAIFSAASSEAGASLTVGFASAALLGPEIDNVNYAIVVFSVPDAAPYPAGHAAECDRLLFAAVGKSIMTAEPRGERELRRSEKRRASDAVGQ